MKNTKIEFSNISDNLEAEVTFYQSWLDALQQAAQIAVERITALGEQIKGRQGRAPIEHYKWRIKTAASMQEKLRRNHLPATLEMAKSKIYDAAGVRVICPFINDVYLLANDLRQQTDFLVHTVKDYILHPKDNGYRSYHIIIMVTVLYQEELLQVPVEIQLRTIAMDCWASLEHQLRYKKHLKESAALAAELKRCADEMASTDLSMQAIQEVLDLQNGACIETALQKEEGTYETVNRR